MHKKEKNKLKIMIYDYDNIKFYLCIIKKVETTTTSITWMESCQNKIFIESSFRDKV